MKLIKNIQIYAPENLGVKDVLISDSKIEKIDNHIELSYPIETIDGTGCILTPGLIDRMFILLVVVEKPDLFLELGL